MTEATPSTSPSFSPDDDSVEDSLDDDSLEPTLSRHLGIGGHGTQVADRLALLAKLAPAAATSSETGTVPGAGNRRRGTPPSLYFGDLRAGDGASTAGTIEECRDRGVLPFSVRYVGGVGGEEAAKAATAAADYEYEDVSSGLLSVAKHQCGAVVAALYGEEEAWLFGFGVVLATIVAQLPGLVCVWCSRQRLCPPGL